jgi:ABC-type lipoprotein export system ATPase subunit
VRGDDATTRPGEDPADRDEVGDAPGTDVWARPVATRDAAGPPGPTLVVARGVRKTYRRGPEEVHALDGVSFSLRRGEVVALVGPSGSGKTTLLNVICGWEHPEQGELEWIGGDPTPPERRPWSDLAIVPQDLGLLEELSVRESVELPVRLARLRGPEWPEKVTALLDGFGLEPYADRQPGEMSLGERQRLALARALVLHPRLLLADEPTGHQDAGWARAVFRSFRWAAASGTTCLVATHSDEFLRYVDRVLAMRDGHLQETERPEAP